jgi:hypothetical protein
MARKGKVSERLQWALEQSGKSIRSFHRELAAKKVRGSSYATVFRYVTGKRPAPHAFLEVAARLLGVRFVWLTTGEGPRTDEDADRLALRDKFIQAQAAAIADRTAEDWELVNAAVDAALPNTADHVKKGYLHSALLRFARKLRDTEHPESPWQGSARGELLTVAARFVVGVNSAFDAAALQHPHAKEGEPGFNEFHDDLLLRVSSAAGFNVTWYDAVMELFGRRVMGLGERTNHWMDLHAPSMADRMATYQRSI